MTGKHKRPPLPTKKTMRAWAKEHRAVIALALWFVAIILADAVFWFSCLTMGIGLVLVLRDWRNRDIAKGNAEVERICNERDRDSRKNKAG